jgi:putative copper resistance protein D
MLLHDARIRSDAGWSVATAAATQRFSNMGVISVAVLLATGVVNTSNTVGIGDALTDTGYGQLLLAKIALFLVMMFIAIFNRHVLAPRLSEPGRMERLQRNSVVEIALGLLIIAIVGALGTMAPTLAMHSH